MINLFGEPYTDAPKKIVTVDPKKRAWENGFQKWSNTVFLDERNHYGACGYGAICDYCKDNSYGRPCVRALNEMCRVKRKSIDYADKSESNDERCFDGRMDGDGDV